MIYPQTQRTYNLVWHPVRRSPRYPPQGVRNWYDHILDAHAVRQWRMWELINSLDKPRAAGVKSQSETGATVARIENGKWKGEQPFESYVTDAISVAAFRSDSKPPETISAETDSDNASLIDFRSFAIEYPDKLFPILQNLRPEFQEMFIEYWIVGKSQSFLAKTHGCIQTRIWQTLRIIERAIGALIVLGNEPKPADLLPIIESAGLENTPSGSLTTMISIYAETRSYAQVAKWAKCPVPVIRKIFRPAIVKLTAAKDVRTISVGHYLHNLTHQASLTKSGLSKRSIARLRRVRQLKFTAPPTGDTPLLNLGDIDKLDGRPWMMFEAFNEHKRTDIFPRLQSQRKRLFGKHPVQIFAPVEADGNLEFGYLFARSTANLVNCLQCKNGVGEIVATFDDFGNFRKAVEVPDMDVQKLIAERFNIKLTKIHVGDYVQILTGEAANYCGVVTGIKGTQKVVEVKLLTDRTFTVTADPTALKFVASKSGTAFWASA